MKTMTSEQLKNLEIIVQEIVDDIHNIFIDPILENEEKDFVIPWREFNKSEEWFPHRLLWSSDMLVLYFDNFTLEIPKKVCIRKIRWGSTFSAHRLFDDDFDYYYNRELFMQNPELATDAIINFCHNYPAFRKKMIKYARRHKVSSIPQKLRVSDRQYLQRDLTVSLDRTPTSKIDIQRQDGVNIGNIKIGNQAITIFTRGNIITKPLAKPSDNRLRIKKNIVIENDTSSLLNSLVNRHLNSDNIIDFGSQTIRIADLDDIILSPKKQKQNLSLPFIPYLSYDAILNGRRKQTDFLLSMITDDLRHIKEASPKKKIKVEVTRMNTEVSEFLPTKERIRFELKDDEFTIYRYPKCSRLGRISLIDDLENSYISEHLNFHECYILEFLQNYSRIRSLLIGASKVKKSQLDELEESEPDLKNDGGEANVELHLTPSLNLHEIQISHQNGRTIGTISFADETLHLMTSADIVLVKRKDEKAEKTKIK